MARDNKEIGRFDLADIPPSPRGVPQIEVTFDINADGILHVSAKDKQSGKEQKISIQAKSGLTDEEIQRKIKEAELHEAEDKERKETAEARNEADALVFRAQKSLTEFKDKLPESLVSAIQSRIDNVKKTLTTEDVASIKAKTAELQEYMQKIGEELAKSGATQDGTAPGQGPSAQQSAKPDIEEAEVEIMDNEKK
jgi:molecular chaperone DnaK